MSNTINILKPSVCFEVQKIVGISTNDGNSKTYQVEWAPTWISGHHLVGCEDLIEQFEHEQRMKDYCEVKVEILDSDDGSCNGEILVSDEKHEMMRNFSRSVESPKQSWKDNCNSVGANNSISTNRYDDTTTDGIHSSETPQGTNNGSYTEIKILSVASVVPRSTQNTDHSNTISNNLHTDLQQAGKSGTYMVESAPSQPFPSEQHYQYDHYRYESENNVHGNNVSKQTHSEMSSKSWDNSADMSKVSASSKGYECRICHRKYTCQRTLLKHESIHDTGRPFSCNYCKKMFADGHTLQAHIKIHTTKNRKFPCNYCTKSFFSSRDLGRHTRIHTGERPFLCHICQCTFQRKHVLQKHVQKYHPQQYTSVSNNSDADNGDSASCYTVDTNPTNQMLDNFPS